MQLSAHIFEKADNRSLLRQTQNTLACCGFGGTCVRPFRPPLAVLFVLANVGNAENFQEPSASMPRFPRPGTAAQSLIQTAQGNEKVWMQEEVGYKEIDGDLGTSVLQREVLKGRTKIFMEEEDGQALDSWKSQRTRGKETLQALQEMNMKVRILAQKVAGHNYSMTDSEESALNIIEAWIRTMYSTLNQQYYEDQHEVNQVRDLIMGCTNAAETALATVNDMNTAVVTKRQQHGECREGEVGDNQSTSAACEHYATYRQTSPDRVPPHCLETKLQLDYVEAVDRNKVNKMESCLKGAKVWLDPLYEKYIDCEAAGDTYSNKKQECDKKQQDFELNFCAYAAKLKDACEEQVTCRRNTVPRRQPTYKEIKLSEAARKAEFETGQQILCFFKVFEANNTDKPATLSTCMNKTFDSSNYTITYPPEPPPVLCNTEPHQPCDGQFLQKEYEEKSWYNIAPATTCNSCPAVPKAVFVWKPSYAQCAASSVYLGDSLGYKHGLGLLDSPQAWSAQQANAGEWWQMDVGSVQKVAGVVTQARSGSTQRVTSYMVQVSSNGNYFEDVDGGKVFTANKPGDKDDAKVKNFFANLVQARFVKIVVKTWVSHISMRAAVLLPEAPSCSTPNTVSKNLDKMQAAGWTFADLMVNLLDDKESCSADSFHAYAASNLTGTATKTFDCEGVVVLKYGNCWNSGKVNVYLNGQKIHSADPLTSKTVTFTVQPFNKVELKDEEGNAVIQIISLEIKAGNLRADYKQIATNKACPFQTWIKYVGCPQMNGKADTKPCATCLDACSADAHCGMVSYAFEKGELCNVYQTNCEAKDLTGHSGLSIWKKVLETM